MSISDSNLEAMFSMESNPRGVIEEPPFRILVLGGWSGNGEKREFASRGPIAIDRDNFDEVMRKLGPSLDLDLQGTGLSSLSLTFAELDDFHPDRIFGKVPLFAELRDTRRNLLDKDTFYEAAHDVRTWFPVPEEPKKEAQQEAAPEEPGDGIAPVDLLDHILSQPGGGAVTMRPKTAESREFNAMLKELVWPHLVSVDESEQSKLIGVIDDATGDLMRKILHNHQFQALEAAWRGLYLMIRRTETDTNLSIHLLDATKDELTDSLKSAGSLSET